MRVVEALSSRFANFFLVPLLFLFVFVLLSITPASGYYCNSTAVVRAKAAYFASDGTILTPKPPVLENIPSGPPDPYPPSISCTVRFYPEYDAQQIAASNQTVFSVSFYLLNLQPGDTLAFYLSTNSTPETTLTSSSSASTFVTIPATSFDYLRVVFTSSGSAQNETGFGFGAYIQTGGCLFGVAQYFHPGQVTSGNYISGGPAHYPTIAQCGFRISTNGSEVIKLAITYNVEFGFDFLYVYDGDPFDADELQLVRQLSGPGVTGSTLDYSFVSSSSELYFEFKSDKSVAYEGFVATWTFLSISSCSSLTNLNDSGLVTDGSGLGLTVPDADCTWQILSLTAGSIRIYFTDIDIGSGSLTVTDDSGNQLSYITGTHLDEIPSPVYYDGPRLDVHFTSQDAVQGFGFIFHAGSCIAQVRVTQRQGIIDDGSGANNYADNNLCKWLIDLRQSVPGAQNISFTFSEVDIEYRFDTVTVYDGAEEETSPQIVQLSGPYSSTNRFYSSSPVMLIVFQTDRDVNGQGWSLSYQPEFPEDSSSDNTVLIVAIVVPVVVVGLLLCMLMLCVLVLAVLFFLTRRGPRKKVYVEPDYAAVVFDTIIPLLKDDFIAYELAGAELEDLEIEGHVALYTKFEKLVLNTNFAHALIIGSKKSNEELNMSMLCKFVLLIYAFNGNVRDLLLSETKKELANSKANTLWRETSAVTTMFALYAKVVAIQYIWKTLVVVLHDIKELCEEAGQGGGGESNETLPRSEYTGLELDPRRLSAQENAMVNRLQLELISQRLLNAIIRSLPYFPEELRRFFHDLRDEISAHFSTVYADKSEDKIERKISKEYHKAAAGFLFLRLFAPAIISPHEYGIYREKPERELQRFLILISKVLQNLSNGVYFRESYMENMNTFISKNLPTIRQYFDDLPDRTGSHISQLSKTSSQSEIVTHGDALSIFDLENSNSSTESSSDSDIEAGAPKELAAVTSQSVPLYFRQNKKFSKAAREKTLQNLRFYAVAAAEDVDRVLETTLVNPDRKKLRKQYASFLAGLTKVDQVKKARKKSSGGFQGTLSRKKSNSDPDKVATTVDKNLQSPKKHGILKGLKGRRATPKGADGQVEMVDMKKEVGTADGGDSSYTPTDTDGFSECEDKSE